MAKTVTFVTLLQMTQEYISQNYAAALSDKKKLGQLRSYIDKYLNDTGYTVEGYSSDEMKSRKSTSTAGMILPSPIQTARLKRRRNIFSLRSTRWILSSAFCIIPA